MYMIAVQGVRGKRFLLLSNVLDTKGTFENFCFLILNIGFGAL